MTATTRGPLPSHVYWRRRLVLLLVVVALVAGAVRLFASGGEEPAAQQTPRASQAAAETGTESEAPPDVTASDTPSESRGTDGATDQQGADGATDQQGADGTTSKKKQRQRPVLAEPDSVCSDRDVAVTPSARNPVAGSPVTFSLELRTISTEACTWHVSPSTVTVKITSGDDDIWTSQECPRAIPSEDVVVRNNVSTKVEVTWSGRRSDDECSRLTEWAMPGWYYVDAAALAGEPSDLHFELTRPERPVEKQVVKPDRKNKQDAGRERAADRKPRGDQDRG